MKNIKAVIFDFDGTIADTMPFLTQIAVKLITEKYNISKEEAKNRYLETTGVDFATQMDTIFPHHPNKSEVVSIFESKKLEGIFTRPIFSEVIPTLKYFRNKKIKTFICSSTKQEIITKYSQSNKIDDLVDGLLGYKPDFGKSEQIDFILQHYKLQPDEVLFVGDSLRDYDLAKDKKIKFIGISRIFEKEEFQKKGALSVSCLTDFTELFDTSEKYFKSFPKIIAHRGHLTGLPENAMSSIKEVLKLSLDYVEIDVGITKDDQIILHHDSTLERTTNGRGWIRDKTLEEIKGLRLKDPEGKITSESIPTLEEVMEIMGKQSINLQIDAKYYDSDIFAKTLVQRTKSNNIEKTIITSTNLKFLKKIRKLDADIRLGYDPQDMYDAKLINNLKIMYKTYTDFRPITFEEMRDEFISQIILRSKEIDAETVCLDYRLILQKQKELNLIDRFHKNGIKVDAWTVNKEDEMRLLIKLGVDMITTDRADLLIHLKKYIAQ